MIAERYVPAACVLLAIALVPTIIHSYTDRVADDGRRAAAVPAVLAGIPSTPGDRNEGWGRRRFDTDDWIARDYRGAGGEVLTLTVVRTLDAKTVYHHPELAVAYGTSFVGSEVTHFAERPDIPVHMLRPGPGVVATGAYVLHYDTRFVANPIAFQIRTAGELLVSPRRPMTLFFVLGRHASDAEATPPAVSLLFSAIDRFLQGPVPPPPTR